MTPRAPALSPDDRRQALVEATVPLLLEYGRTLTTRQIAEGAGVAEGTIFRAFESKDDLITAALEHAFSFEPFVADLRRVEPKESVDAMTREVVTLLQKRFRGVFALMAAVGTFGPPHARRHDDDGRRQVGVELERLLAPYADQLAWPVNQFIDVVRLLTFSGTHPHISDGRTLTAEQIVSVVLDGMRKKES